MPTPRLNPPPEIHGGPRTLFPTKEIPEPYRKAVQVLHSKPRQEFSLLQRKASNALLKHALEAEPAEDGFFEIPIGRLRDNVGLNSNNFAYLRDSTRDLMNIVFEWDVLTARDKRVKYKASTLIPEVELTSTLVRYQISSQMLAELKRPEIWALIDMSIVRKFKRAASLAIWEFAVRFEGIERTKEVPWKEFRDMILGDEVARQGMYQEYKYFKFRQLKPAMAEINAVTDHTLTLMEAKNGRAVESLYFEVRRKTARQNDLASEDLATLRELKQVGVKQQDGITYIRKYGRDKIAEAIVATKRRIADRKSGELNSPAGWLKWRLRQEEDKPPTRGAPERLRPVRKKVDFREAFLTYRKKEAEAYFHELDPESQSEHLAEYDEQQRVLTLKLQGRKKTPAAADAFFRWLAQKTWGDPTSEQVLEFAQEHLAASAD